MTMSRPPTRVHLLGHANPITQDVQRFGFEDVEEYLEFTLRHVPAPFKLTYDLGVLKAEERQHHGGRNDDAARIKDLNGALKDSRTAAIVALSGGAWFSRLLPHLNFAPLKQRRTPLWVMGFSEMTTLVNHVAAYPCGRALYWLTPNFLGHRLHPAEAARAALAEFWLTLPDVLAGHAPAAARHLDFGSLQGTLVHGRLRSGKVRLLGGCLSVLVSAVGGPLTKQLRPAGKWLVLEDIKETPYRSDRHLAALKVAGWFDKLAGILVGDFHMLHEDVQPALVELLKYHLPPRSSVPIVTTRSFGHTWPITPVLLNRPLAVTVAGSNVTLGPALSPA